MRKNGFQHAGALKRITNAATAAFDPQLKLGRQPCERRSRPVADSPPAQLTDVGKPWTYPAIPAVRASMSARRAQLRGLENFRPTEAATPEQPARGRADRRAPLPPGVARRAHDRGNRLNAARGSDPPASTLTALHSHKDRREIRRRPASPAVRSGTARLAVGQRLRGDSRLPRCCRLRKCSSDCST